MTYKMPQESSGLESGKAHLPPETIHQHRITFLRRFDHRLLHRFRLREQPPLWMLPYGSFILLCPLAALLYRAHQYSWPTLRQRMAQPIVMNACRMTLGTALLATLLNGVLGMIIAWILVRLDFPGKRALDMAVDLPFALPTSVGGLTLMIVYSDRGWLGPICQRFGVRIAFTRLGVLLAMMFVSFPFIVRTVQPLLSHFERDLEEAAWCLGASPWMTFWWVIFPYLASALVTGATLAFSRAISEYGSIVLVAANIPHRDLVVSVLIFQRLEQYDHQGALSIAVLMLGISFSIVLTINSIQMHYAAKQRH